MSGLNGERNVVAWVGLARGVVYGVRVNGERNVVGWVGLARRVVFEVRGAVNTRDEHLRLPERGRERSCCNSSNQTTAERVGGVAAEKQKRY